MPEQVKTEAVPRTGGQFCNRPGCGRLSWAGFSGRCSEYCRDMHEIELARDEARAENRRLRELIHSYTASIMGEQGAVFDSRMKAWEDLVLSVGQS